MTCPTSCDDDCDALCHEAHEPAEWRYHDPAACQEGRLELTVLGLEDAHWTSAICWPVPCAPFEEHTIYYTINCEVDP